MDVLPATGVGSADGDLKGMLLEATEKNSLHMAWFAAHLIKETVLIISVVSDRSGFDLIKSYEGISGTIGDGVLLFSVGFWHYISTGPFNKSCLNSIDLCLDGWRRSGFGLAVNYDGLFVWISTVIGFWDGNCFTAVWFDPIFPWNLFILIINERRHWRRIL
jgi:hypothetical protein